MVLQDQERRGDLQKQRRSREITFSQSRRANPTCEREEGVWESFE